MDRSPILAPVVALAAWTFVMMTWMYVTRLPAMTRAGLPLKGGIGMRGGDLDGVVEDRVQWKAHNYSHLMEQPTVFYAVALSLALMGLGGGISLWLAWAYVGLRVLHSLVQATSNIVHRRFLVFIAASLCLLGLTLRAIAGVLHGLA